MSAGIVDILICRGSGKDFLEGKLLFARLAFGEIPSSLRSSLEEESVLIPPRIKNQHVFINNINDATANKNYILTNYI